METNLLDSLALRGYGRGYSFIVEISLMISNAQAGTPSAKLIVQAISCCLTFLDLPMT